MTWVAAVATGNKIKGFEYGTRVEYDLTDGTTVHGKIVVQGTDKLGDVHGIELDTDVQPCELHWLGTGLVRPETPAASPLPKLTPTMQEALSYLRGTLHGKARKGCGVQLQTARALHRRGLAYLDETHRPEGDWLLTLVEPEVQELSDDELGDLPLEEAALLEPLDPRRRYRALRHAHIVSQHFGERDIAAGYPQLARTRLEALRERVALVNAWQSFKITDREYGQHTDYAGQQWVSARTQVTNVWWFGKGWGEPLLVVEAATAEAAEKQADRIIAADPVGYRELTTGYGRRRITVQEWADARRVEAAAQAG